jgi:hypothetical protein
MHALAVPGMVQEGGGIIMATTMKKDRPADKGKKKAVAPAKGGLKPKIKEEACYSTDTAFAERLCCCEDLCC